MGSDRVTDLWIKGVRSIREVRLKLGALTVLIGENGGGKSSVLECCELLRRASEPEFISALTEFHGGLGSLLRHGEARLGLGVRVESDDEHPLQYDLQLGREGSEVVVTEESLGLGPYPGHDRPFEVFHRTTSSAWVYDSEQRDMRELPDFPRRHLLLTAFGLLPPQPAIPRLIDVLRQIELHLPFEVTPRWFARSAGREWGMRDTVRFEQAEELSRLGLNLANAFHSLKNDFGEAHWHETMEYVRLGLGLDIESVNVGAGAGGAAQAGLFLRFQQFPKQVSAASLSDGMLTYLALVALHRLPSHRVLLAFDEPDLHLHPELLVRAVQLFEEISESCPVLIATHSDRFLDALEDPASSVVLCDLDVERATRFFRPEPAALERWLERYRGLGEIRAEGHERSVLTREEAQQ